MKKATPNEIYHFYISDNHWLFMEKDKMLAILNDIKDKVIGNYDVDEAIELIKDITPTELAALKAAYIQKWRDTHDDIETRLNRYQNRVILVNAN